MAITHDRPIRKSIRLIDQKPPRLGILALVAVLAGGSIAWNTIRDQQIRKIQQAQTILTQACSTNLNTNALGTAQQVDSATQLLRSVPPVPGLGQALAQSQLAESASCIQQVQSTAGLLQAQTLSESAFKVTDETVLTTPEWQTLQTNLNSAIALLKAIPPTATVYPQAQERLPSYESQANEITARIQTEAGAVNAYLRSVGLLEQTDKLLATPTQENLSLAEGNVQEAIRLIEAVPQGTTVSASRAVTVATYQAKLTEIQTQWINQQIQPLISEFQAFGANLDTNLGYAEYSEKWSDLKNRFEVQTQTSQIVRDYPVTKALAVAVQRYDDALSVWRYCYEKNCYSSFQAGFFLDSPSISWLPETLELDGGRTLASSYALDSTFSLLRQQRFVQLNPTLRIIWQDAELKVEDARERL